MKTALTFTTLILLTCISARAQMVVKVGLKDKIDGICDYDNVYALINSFAGQVEPECSVSKVEMQEQLNQVQFLKNHPKLKGRGMAGVYINCKGEALSWRIDGEINPELDAQLLKIFRSYQNWKAGTLNGENVDCSVLISYKIKKGKLKIE